MLVIGGVLLVLILVGLAVGNAGATGHSAKQSHGREKPHASPAGPAADEPTPDRSVTASRQQVERAKRHTPPS